MKIRSLAPVGFSIALAGLTCVAVAVGAHAQAGGQVARTAAPAPAPAAAAANGPPAGMNVIDTSSPFDHDVHLNAAKMGGKQMGCESCHQKMVNNDGTCPKAEVRFPPHEACAGCHAASFYTPPLTICTNCHTTAQFSKKNSLRELTRQVTPRKAEFSHRSHLDPRKGTDCTSCHAVLKGGDVMGIPSHPNCCQCHAGSGLNGKVVEPTMNKCGSCHDTSKNAGRPPSKIHDFHHKEHREDPRIPGTSTTCVQCHNNMVEATTLRSIHIPPMPVCVQCHDGSDPNKPNPNPAIAAKGGVGSGAFHFSSCLKCHIAGSITGVPLPKDHPTEAAPPGAIK